MTCPHSKKKDLTQGLGKDRHHYCPGCGMHWYQGREWTRVQWDNYVNGAEVPGGEDAHYRAGVHNDDFYSEHCHPECWAAMLESDLGYDDEFYPMDQKRGKTYEESHG